MVLFLVCLQILSNGKYKSAQHRAITNATQARLSVATFHDPAKAVKISPVSELVSESSPSTIANPTNHYIDFIPISEHKYNSNLSITCKKQPRN
jgi:isopenicillin N synthase-like dioxygenase